MGRVRAEVEVAVLASVAEELWYDTARWPTFVDGLAHVAKVEGDWPRAGRVLWDSRPEGRGRVEERVLSHRPRVGQTLAVEDEKIVGEQRVRFTPMASGCRVALFLEYRIKERRGVTPVVDLVFVRRPMTDALRRTLARLRRELEAPPL